MLPAAAFQLDSLQNFISQQCITTKLYMYYVLILEKSDKRNISWYNLETLNMSIANDKCIMILNLTYSITFKLKFLSLWNYGKSRTYM